MTERIQKENNDKDRNKYMNHKTEIICQRNADRENVLLQIRENFCNNVVSTMGKYYADINRYATLARRKDQTARADRSISIQCRFVLHSRLDSIDSAKPLLDKLDDIHRISGDENVTLVDFLDKSEELLMETSNFIHEYSK